MYILHSIIGICLLSIVYIVYYIIPYIIIMVLLLLYIIKWGHRMLSKTATPGKYLCISLYHCLKSAVGGSILKLTKFVSSEEGSNRSDGDDVGYSS